MWTLLLGFAVSSSSASDFRCFRLSRKSSRLTRASAFFALQSSNSAGDNSPCIAFDQLTHTKDDTQVGFQGLPVSRSMPTHWRRNFLFPLMSFFSSMICSTSHRLCSDSEDEVSSHNTSVLWFPFGVLLVGTEAVGWRTGQVLRLESWKESAFSVGL